MRYSANTQLDHNVKHPLGVLITNLGTPMAPTPKAVRRYLAEFLWDPRIVELPRWLWWPMLHAIILPFRGRTSAHAYQKIWTDEGSPLQVITKKQAEGLEKLLNEKSDRPIKVAYGMRYGSPSIADALESLRQANVDKITLLPLYPQYASSTVGSTFDAVANVLKRWRVVPELKMISHYADNQHYIVTLASSIKKAWKKEKPGTILLFSFHGLPKNSIYAGDPYYCWCLETARLVAKTLNLEKNRWRVVFQSRFGRQKWIEPYCDKTLMALPKEGHTDVDIICPGFAADCLETLEEISIRYRTLFQEAGGKSLHYISALNDSPEHLEALAEIIIPTIPKVPH